MHPNSPLAVLSTAVSGLSRAQLTELLAEFRKLPAETKADRSTTAVYVAITTTLQRVIRQEDAELPTATLAAAIRSTYEAHGWTLARDTAERVTVDAYMRLIEDRHQLVEYIDGLAEESAQRVRGGELSGETAAESNRKFVGAILDAALSA